MHARLLRRLGGHSPSWYLHRTMKLVSFRGLTMATCSATRGGRTEQPSRKRKVTNLDLYVANDVIKHFIFGRSRRRACSWRSENKSGVPIRADQTRPESWSG